MRTSLPEHTFDLAPVAELLATNHPLAAPAAATRTGQRRGQGLKASIDELQTMVKGAGEGKKGAVK